MIFTLQCRVWHRSVSVMGAYVAGELLLQHLQLLCVSRCLRLASIERLELRAQVLRQRVRRLRTRHTLTFSVSHFCAIYFDH